MVLLLNCGVPMLTEKATLQHYIPTLLAAKGLENETSGAFGPTYAEWGRAPNRGGSSPHSFWWVLSGRLTFKCLGIGLPMNA